MMKRILFVCVENSCRSQIAEAFAIPDPKGMPPEEFRAVRDLIRWKVQELLAKLA